MTKEKLQKIKEVALDYSAPEKGNASRILAKHGVYIDIAGIEWTKAELEMFKDEERDYMFGFDPLTINLVTA
jgi:hypothetical protein